MAAGDFWFYVNNPDAIPSRGLMGNKELSFINLVDNFSIDKYSIKNLKNKLLGFLKTCQRKIEREV